jgi:hypothetical protein
MQASDQALDILQRQLKELKASRDEAVKEKEGLKRHFERETQLMSSAWSSFCLEFQKVWSCGCKPRLAQLTLCGQMAIRNREGRGNAVSGAGRGSFLDKQRKLALQQHAVTDA